MPAFQDSRSKKWFYRVGHKGRSYFKGGFRSAALARQAEVAFLDQLMTEEMYPELKGRDMLIGDAVDWYLQGLPACKKTVYIDKARLGLVARFFEKKKVSEIGAEDIERFLEKLPALRIAATPRLKTLSDQTKNHYLANIRTFYNRMKKRGKYLGSNPALMVSFKKVPRARLRFLYPAEEQWLSPMVRDDNVLWPYYFMALHTGLRIRELMGIRVKDVDLVMNQIFIPNSKNSKSRYVPLSPNVTTFVADRMKGNNPDARLLPDWSYTYLRKRFMNCCAAVGIKDLRIHDMRHTFAQRLLSRGESIYLVSKLMGHSSVAVTQSHYGHLSISDLSRTVSGIDGVISFSNSSAEPVRASHTEIQNALKNQEFRPGQVNT